MKPARTFPPVFTLSLAVTAGSAAVYAMGPAAAVWAAVIGTAAGIFIFRGFRHRFLHPALLAAGFCAGGAAMDAAIAGYDAVIGVIAAGSEVPEAVLTVRDGGCAPLCGWMEAPTSVECLVNTPSGESIGCRAVTASGADWPTRPGWGDEFLISGRWMPPRQGRFQTPRLIVESIRPVRRGSGVMRTMLDMRDRTITAVTGHFGDDDDPEVRAARGVMAAMIFGCRQGVPRETMENFVLAGTIHLFSVSGIHIAVLAAMAGMLTFWMPFRLRYLLMPLMLAPYLLMTGCSTPALRAWCMFAAWSFGRGLTLRTPPMRILALTAAAMIVIAPEQLLRMGFQYSFTVTAALLLMLPLLRRLKHLLRADEHWRPMDPENPMRRAARYCGNLLLDAAAVALTAFAVGAPLTLFYQGKAAIVSVAANIVIAPVLPLVCLTGAAAALAPCSFTGGLCRAVTMVIPGAAELAAQLAGNCGGFGRPAWYLAGAGVAGILAALGFFKARGVRAAGAVIYAVFWIVCYFKPLFYRDNVMWTVPAYGGVPTVVAAVPAPGGGRAAAIIGDINPAGVEAVERFLTDRGITSFETVAVEHPASRTWHSAGRLTAALPADLVLVTDMNPRKNRRAAQAAGEVRAGFFTVTEDAGVEVGGHTLLRRRSGRSYRILWDGEETGVVKGRSNIDRFRPGAAHRLPGGGDAEGIFSPEQPFQPTPEPDSENAEPETGTSHQDR